MKKRSLKAVCAPLFSVLVALFYVPVSTGAVELPSEPGCCTDRWDPWWTEREMWGPSMERPEQRNRMTRHWFFMHSGVPQEYSLVKNPLEPTLSVVNAGRALYQQHCSKCHGVKGMGDGDIAHSLSPSPALLAFLIQRPAAVNGYLLWSISEGGLAFGTDMPAFKAKLSQDEIWKIIAFMRAGFPIDTP